MQEKNIGSGKLDSDRSQVNGSEWGRKNIIYESGTGSRWGSTSSPCGHRRRRKALTFEHPPPPLKFSDCRGGFVKFHPPPEAPMGSNISYPFTLRRRKKSTTAFHPPPFYCGGQPHKKTTIMRANEFKRLETVEKAFPN